MADPQRLPKDAQAAYQRARHANVAFVDRFDVTARWALAIDGLFGIGLSRPLEGPFAAAVEQINALDCPVLAIDVPSGLDADSGRVIGDAVAVKAHTTLTLIGDKPGLHTGSGRDYAGLVLVDSLELDVESFGAPLARLIKSAMFPNVFVPRPHASHKGSFGDVTVIGGADGMVGAVLLAARMAAMAGAGRVFAAFAGTAPALIRCIRSSCVAMRMQLICRGALS